jgi:hypothetical protein
MTRQEIEQKMDALARGNTTSLATRKSQKRFYRLARQLKEMEH